MSASDSAAQVAHEKRDRVVRQISDLVRARNIPLATQVARTALDEGVVHPLLLGLRAHWLDDQGRDGEALADLEGAIGLAPEDAPLRNSYGQLLSKLGRWDQAVGAFERAVALKPDFAPAFRNLGYARQGAGDLRGAETAFRRAYELAPDDAEPLSHLAHIASRRSEWDAARRYAEQALSADSSQALALVTLVSVAIATGDLAGADALAASALAGDGLAGPHRVMMLNNLGDLRHAQQRYAEAFDAYRQSNELCRQIYAPQFAAPGRETVASFADLLIECFERSPVSLWSVSGAKGTGNADVAAHIFLIGFARSGTTLLENVLAAHPDVVALGEKEALAAANEAYLSTDKGIDRLAVASEERLAELRRDYWQHVERFCGAVGGKVFIDKRPMGALKLPLIVKLFPSAKILFAVRDPRDVILSCYRRQFLLNPAMYELLDLRGAARFYDQMMRLAKIFRTRFGLPWLETRHESLVADFDGEMARVLAFAGLGWSDEMRAFADKARARDIWTPSATQVVKGLNAEGVEQWRHYREQLAPAIPTLRPWIKAYGYDGF